MNSNTCTASKPGWQCLREAGHDGPHAAAPTRGKMRCPYIERCTEDGCHGKCGPGAKADGDGWPFWAALALVVAAIAWWMA